MEVLEKGDGYVCKMKRKRPIPNPAHPNGI